MALAIWASAGCESGSSVGSDDDAAMDPVTPDDAGSPRMFDAGPPCTEDAECDDGVACTRDLCDPMRRVCRQSLDFAMCDDGIFCNGVEQCTATGCMPGPPETCNDSDVCTIDSCDEAERVCRHNSRDFDGDGEADWHCGAGTDCDDRDPTRGSSVNEICADSIDNDCDEQIDESECGRPPHDLCEDALEIGPTGGSYTLTADGATNDYTLTCGASGRKDVVLTFTLDEPQDVELVAEGQSITYVALRSDCGDAATERECQSGFPGQIRARALPAGTYYVIVADALGDEINVDVTFTDPTLAPTNETCEAPLDISAGGSTMADFVDVADDLTLSCGVGSSPDLVYTFTTEAERDVILSAIADSGDTMSFSVRSTCDDGATQLRCTRGAPASSRLHRVPAGTYYVIVEGPSYREVDFTLTATFEDPTDPPAGDTCDVALPLPLDTTTEGTLSDKQDDHDISCGFSNRDAVYSFVLDEARDVTVTSESGSYTYLSVRPDAMCTDSASELRCTSGSPARTRVRDLAAGTYYLLVESFTAADFELTVETTAPTTVVPVADNDICASAHVVPETGGLFSGDTTTMLNDYSALCGAAAASNDAVFRLDLTERKEVTASTEGSAFDTVLHLHAGTCTSGAEVECDDDDGEGLTSMITRTLDPGTYYFVVDGRGTGRIGAYLFEVIVRDP